MVEPLGYEVQVYRPLPGLSTGYDLIGRLFGIIEAEAGRELDCDRAPLPPSRRELVCDLPAYAPDANAFTRRPVAGRRASGPNDDRPAESRRMGHLVILPYSDRGIPTIASRRMR